MGNKAPAPWLQFVNASPDRWNPSLFPRVENRVWRDLVRLQLTAVQWQIMVLLFVLQLGASRYRAAEDSGDGNDAFAEAADGFGCDAVAVNSGFLAAISARSTVVIRRELRRLSDANLVTILEQGYKGRPQVICVNLDSRSWRPDALGAPKAAQVSGKGNR